MDNSDFDDLAEYLAGPWNIKSRTVKNYFLEMENGQVFLRLAEKRNSKNMEKLLRNNEPRITDYIAAIGISTEEEAMGLFRRYKSSSATF